MTETGQAYPELGNNFKGPFSPCQVAKYIVGLSGNQRVPELGVTKLNKLVYIAHGWLLGLTDEPLVAEEPETWQYGPVFRSLYNALAHLSKSLTLPERGKLEKALEAGVNLDHRSSKRPIEEDGGAEKRLVDYVCGRYGSYDAQTLIRKTHAYGSPWHICYSAGSPTISNKLIAQYYKEGLGISEQKR